MNKFIGIGRLTRDPEIKTAQTGDGQMTIARFSLAVDRKFKREGEQSADFLPCVAFRKQAESIEKWCRQGTKIAIEAHVQTGSYTNKDGVKVYTTDFIVDSWEFAGAKNEDTQNQAQNNIANIGNSGWVSKDELPSVDGFMNIPDGIEDDGLPF